MRLYKGKDYYDGVAYDDTITFVRDPIFMKAPIGCTTLSYGPASYCDLGYVCVAGISYPYVRVKLQGGSYGSNGVFYYDTDSFFQDFDPTCDTVRWVHFSPKYLSKLVKEHLERGATNKHIEWLIDNRVVVGASCTHMHFKTLTFDYKIRGDAFISNISELKTFEFYKRLDAYQTYQAIAQYVGGVLANNKPMVTLSNNERIKKAGFDTVTSFRKSKK